jgi:hypothetical protein
MRSRILTITVTYIWILQLQSGEDIWCTREQQSTESHYLDKIFQKMLNITSSTVKVPQRVSTAVIHKGPVSILRSHAPVG